MDARQIADALDETADLSDLAGETPFKGRAYRKAAGLLRSLNEDLGALIESGKLQEMPGVGEAILEKIVALRRDGTPPALEKLRAAVPTGLRGVLRRTGLSARKVIALHKDLGVASVEDLSRALIEGRLEGAKGFDRKTLAALAARLGGTGKRL